MSCRRSITAVALTAALLAAAISVPASMALAAPSCSNWLQQTDKSYWRLCVGDDGKNFCEYCPANHRSYADCYRVKCK
jgi:uncharacterized membrane protein